MFFLKFFKFLRIRSFRIEQFSNLGWIDRFKFLGIRSIQNSDFANFQKLLIYKSKTAKQIYS